MKRPKDGDADDRDELEDWAGLSSVTRRGMIGFLAASAGALLGGCGLLVSKSSYRYRMRVEGEHPGAAVYEILAEKTSGALLAEEKPGGSIIKGEAVIIETPSRPVFALLTPDTSGENLIEAITRALTPDIPWNGQPNFWKAVNRLSSAGEGAVKSDLPRDQWPLMVRFGDVNDPRTVERVDPQAIAVRRISLETTVDPITTGIKQRLRWLSEPERSLDWRAGPTTSPTLAQTLRNQDFLREISK